MKQQGRKQECQISNTNSHNTLEIIGVFRKPTAFIKKKNKTFLEIQGKILLSLYVKNPRFSVQGHIKFLLGPEVFL